MIPGLLLMGLILGAGLGSLFLGSARVSDSTAKAMAVLIQIVLTIGSAAALILAAGAQVVVDPVILPWSSALGIAFEFKVDGLSLLMVLLTAGITLGTILGTRLQTRRFYALLMLLEAALLIVFSAGDLLLFYIGWELSMIPILFMILTEGGPNRRSVALRTFIMTLTGSVFMLLALLLIWLYNPVPSPLSMTTLVPGLLPFGMQVLVLAGFGIAFAIKTPLFPFHGWQADTYQTASAPTAMIVASLMSKMGIYGFVRILSHFVPDALAAYGWLIVLLAVIGVIYAGAMALVQTNGRRLIAYSSMAHLGIVAAALISPSAEAQMGVGLQLVSHALVVFGLIFVLDILERHFQSGFLTDFGGVSALNPFLGSIVLILVLASIGLPGTSGFAAEFLLLLGIAQYSVVVCALVGTGLIIGAWYMLRFYRASMLNPGSGSSSFVLVRFSESAVLLTTVFIIIAIGVYPRLVTGILHWSILGKGVGL
ncbi:NADH-quinone oxidoreductase subunit M [bacterium]|nr:NADH-quinone oxidoreductase subunit M [bacterium]